MLHSDSLTRRERQFATWPGNAAKARIIKKLAAEPRPITVFDYGAGTGGHWPEILSQLENVSLVCFEPHTRSNARLVERLSGLNARVVTELDGVKADYVVSFSVLEHVYDRFAYMATARRLLKPGGTFFLSYDDGHFRGRLELARPSFGPVREHLANLAAPILPKIGLVSRYQRRVIRREVDALVAKANFRVVGERYENLDSMKRLSAAMPLDLIGSFMDAWIALEDDLNKRFSTTGPAMFGDTNVLWREMGTRTLELQS